MGRPLVATRCESACIGCRDWRRIERVIALATCCHLRVTAGPHMRDTLGRGGLMKLDLACFGTSALLLFLMPACLDEPDEGETVAELSAANAGDRAQLAMRWAPVHFQ